MNIENVVQDLLNITYQIEKGKIPDYQTNELFTAGGYDLLFFNSNKKEILFEILEFLCAQYESIKKSNNQFEINSFFTLVDKLTKAVDTTQIPQGLIDIIKENLSNKTARNLSNWYRLQV